MRISTKHPFPLQKKSTFSIFRRNISKWCGWNCVYRSQLRPGYCKFYCIKHKMGHLFLIHTYLHISEYLVKYWYLLYICLIFMSQILFYFCWVPLQLLFRRLSIDSLLLSPLYHTYRYQFTMYIYTIVFINISCISTLSMIMNHITSYKILKFL